MKGFSVFVLCFLSNCAIGTALYSDEDLTDLDESCCTHGETFGISAASIAVCNSINVPEDVEPEQVPKCKAAAVGCCQTYFKTKESCTEGMKFAEEKRCTVPKTDIGKTCCEECSFGRWTGESQGRQNCGVIDKEETAPTSALRNYAYVTCCVESAERPEATTEKIPESTTQKVTTTTEKIVEKTTDKIIPREKCTKGSCEHVCNDEDGKVRCQCYEGYRLQQDKKSCKDINECAEAIDDLCTAEDTVCHNTAGSFKCVPIKKRDVGINCPPGFKRNVLNQVCDDINECQLPRPPCPKYLCENTIGGYKCAGKPGKPYTEAAPSDPTEPSPFLPTSPRNDICPTGFRAGSDDDCLDIDECDERLDDCQRLSQHCINTHGGFFCQDHVSKRCAPGFKVNTITGKCEDIDECEESLEVCKRTEVCINLPGAYNCKSKISTLPKLATKTCQEGTRLRPGGSVCEDIDECREGNHLCDRFQNCINTYGGHECRCKNGFELDVSSSSCVDIDECALKLDNCGPNLHCLNVLGAFTCTRRPPFSATPATPATRTSSVTPAVNANTPSLNDYEYYYEEDNSTFDDNAQPPPPPLPPLPTEKPTTTTTQSPPRATYPSHPYPTRIPNTTPRRPTYRPRYFRPPVPSTTEIPTTPTEPSTTDIEAVPTRPEVPPTMPSKPADRRDNTQPRPDNRRVPERRTDHRNRPMEPPRRTYTPTSTTEQPTTEVIITTPDNPIVLEKDKNSDGSVALNTSDIPKNRWTHLVGRDKPDEPDFDINNLHCLYGYERDANGNCVDVNECESDRHICSRLEMCVNMEGRYRCDCVSGFDRDPSGWCVPSRPPNTTPKTTTAIPTTTSTTTTERTTTEVSSSPRRRYPPPRQPQSCDVGYTYDANSGSCIDIDECATSDICAPNEDCHNVEGGYYCQCGARCRAALDNPIYGDPYEPVPPPDNRDNVITVGAQYGKRGARYLRPTFSRLPSSGAISSSCPWGYKLTADKMCLDIDECAKNVSQCGSEQKCENFFGGYSCQCPAGHKLYGKAGCQDVDECNYGSALPCSYNSKCVNTVGSYRCQCGEGFRNSPTNDKVCVDVDECEETPGICHQKCANAWGSYRCHCQRGYRLENDNRTCVDVDECAEWSSSRVRGRLCGGSCVNTDGSYRCACPRGYRLGQDANSCVDIDECETGEASCANSADAGTVCQNTRGSYHCHEIKCPTGYKLEAKHRCSRIQRSCPMTDWGCLQQPSAYSYNFITFVANIYLPTGSVDLFTMHGPSWRDSVVSFELRMVDVQASPGVEPADLRCFDMRPMDNVCVISLVCSLGGPQVAEMELSMSLYQRGQFAGNAVARLIVIVSQYDF